MCIPCLFTVSTSEAGVIERFGKYDRTVQAGLNCIVFPYESLVGRVSFRVQQIDVRVETKLSTMFSSPLLYQYNTKLFVKTSLMHSIL